MRIAVATANTYYLPFEQTLALIAEAGFQDVEVALYWKGGSWAMAQHLEGVSGRRAAEMISRAGLRVACIHDGGGVLERADSPAGYVNPLLDEYLDGLGYAPECIVCHTPHVAGEVSEDWWDGVSEAVVRALEPYRARCGALTLENTPPFDGYAVPLTMPDELGAFCAAHDVGVTLDTTHYAQMDVDAVAAAGLLRERVRSVHLSDYRGGRPHVYVGEGALDLPGVLGALNGADVRVVTLECSVGLPGEDVRTMAAGRMVERLRTAGERVQSWLHA